MDSTRAHPSGAASGSRSERQLIFRDFGGDQPEVPPSVVRARTAYLPERLGLNRALGRVVSVRKGFHDDEPGLRTCTSKVVPPPPAAVDHRRFQPVPGAPEAFTGTLTTPRIDGWR